MWNKLLVIMESILELMNTLCLDGKIDSANECQAYDDSYPVNNFVNIPFPSTNVKPVNYIKPSTVSYIEDDNVNDAYFYDRACCLLSQCLSSKTRNIHIAETAITLIEEHLLTNFGHYVRGLVYYPHILLRFIQVHEFENCPILDDDIGDMIAKCIEKGQYNNLWALESIMCLLRYIQESDQMLEIKLLAGKYNIDEELYKLASSHNVHDIYYEDTLDCQPYKYEHKDIITKGRDGEYVGFRDVYHCLMYGGKDHLQALIVRWDLYGADHTSYAACVFFDCDMELNEIKDAVNRLSMSRPS